MKLTRIVLGHSLLCSIVCSHRSLIRLLRTARFARALRCAHSFARSLTRSIRRSWESDLCLWNECVDFIQFETTVRCFKIRRIYFYQTVKPNEGSQEAVWLLGEDLGFSSERFLSLSKLKRFLLRLSNGRRKLGHPFNGKKAHCYIQSPAKDAHSFDFLYSYRVINIRCVILLSVFSKKIGSNYIQMIFPKKGIHYQRFFGTGTYFSFFISFLK